MLARAAMQANAEDTRIGIDVARIAVQAGRVMEAAGIYRQLTVQFPADAEAFVGSGALQAQAGDLSGAIQQFRRALALRPADVAARNNLALAMAMSGQSAEAVRMLEQLSREAGTPPVVRANLALAQAGDWRGPGVFQPDTTARSAGAASSGAAVPTALHLAAPGRPPRSVGTPARPPLSATASMAPAVSQPAIMSAPLPAAGALPSLIAETYARKTLPEPVQAPFSAASPAQPAFAEAPVSVAKLTVATMPQAAPALQEPPVLAVAPDAAGFSTFTVAEAWTRKTPAEPAPSVGLQTMYTASLLPHSRLADVEAAEATLVVSPELIAAVWAGRTVASLASGIGSGIGAEKISVQLGALQSEANAVVSRGRFPSGIHHF